MWNTDHRFHLDGTQPELYDSDDAGYDPIEFGSLITSGT